MNDREQKANELLLEIAQCSIAQRHLGGSSMSHPCSKILGVQSTADWTRFQIPEPWSGDIVRAPILFLSSNPSISSYEAYPTGFQDANSLRSYFSERFNGFWIRNGVYARNADTAQADYGDAVRYWASMQRRATELWGRTATPGKDYALSEIVHCKSRNEQGVREALSFCAERYLERLLQCSGAVVIVLVGRKVLGYWNELSALRSSTGLSALPRVPDWGGTSLQPLEGLNRYFVYLGHPSGPEKKKFCDWVSHDKLQEIRSNLVKCGIVSSI